MTQKSGACFWYLYMMLFFLFKERVQKVHFFDSSDFFFFYLKVFSRILLQNIMKCPAINFRSASQDHVL